MSDLDWLRLGAVSALCGCVALLAFVCLLVRRIRNEQDEWHETFRRNRDLRQERDELRVDLKRAKTASNQACPAAGCGADNPRAARFCRRCGHGISGGSLTRLDGSNAAVTVSMAPVRLADRIESPWKPADADNWDHDPRTGIWSWPKGVANKG